MFPTCVTLFSAYEDHFTGGVGPVIWEKYLAESLMSLDKQAEVNMFNSLNVIRKDGSWMPVEHWPQTFWKRSLKGQVIMLTIYVENFVTSGPDHREEWESIRKVVTTADPTIVERVLGVRYTFNRNDEESKVTIDM